MLRRPLLPLLLMLGLLPGGMPLACGSDGVRSPFDSGAGGNAGQAGAEGTAGFKLDIDAGSEPDPTLGGPCEDDGQCDDQVECTRDECDRELGRCRFSPDDAVCDNGVYCDGAERCDLRAGCELGEPVACSDDSTCTIDVCVEETQSCRNDPRDADGDGEATRNCGGSDCDDRNALVSSGATEICGNQLDDDCDDAVDEADCKLPEHDTCAAPLEITEPGYYDLDLTATRLDYPSACADEAAGFRDAVAELVVPEGGPWDVDVIGKLDAGQLALGSGEECGEVGRCESSLPAPLGGSVARLLLRAAEPGRYPIYVAADGEAMVQLQVQLRAPEDFPGDECEQGAPLATDGEPVLVRLPAYAKDFDSACEPLTGDAFLSFQLEQASDITLIAEAQSGLGLPVLALLDGTCKAELTCRKSQPGRLFARALPAGAYQVAVAGTGPDDVSVHLETAPVSDAPPGEGCEDSLPLTPGVETIVDLSKHQDAVNTQCLAGAPDASFALELEAPRDIALIGRFSDGDQGAVSLAPPACDRNLKCSSGAGTQRLRRYAVPAGSYRAVIEAAYGNPVGLSWFERPALAAVNVPLSDDCEGLVQVPEVGGRFSGNTSNAFADFSAGCDFGGQPEGGAPDQILALHLSARHRVVLDMQGSSYETILSVREGTFCPGVELPRACATGLTSARSYLDLDLAAGDYFIQIDGYDGDSGAWKLDVFTAPL